MPTVATLNTVFSATYDRFESGVKGARGALASFEKAIFSVKGALAGLAAGFTVGAVVHELSETAENIDKTAKASDRLGIATEALLGLEHAAKLANIGTEELEGGLTKMAKNIETAAQGGREQQKVLEDLGLRSSELSKIPLDQVFLKIADAINKLPTAGAKTKAAMDIFGKSGAGLLPLIQGGAKDIAATSAEVDKLGASFSRIDAAQVEAANDALTRVGVVLEGVKNQIVIQLAPYIEAVAKGFTDWASSGQSFGEIIADAIDRAVAAMANLLDSMNAFIAPLKDFFKELDKVADFLNEIAGEGARQGHHILPGGGRSGAVRQFLDDIKKNSRDTATEVVANIKKTQDLTANLSGLTKFFNTLKNVGVGAFEAIGHKMDEIAAKIKVDQLTPLQQYTDKLHALQALLATGKLTPDEFAQAKITALKDLASTLPDQNRRAGLQELGTQGTFISLLGSSQMNTEKEILATAKRQEQILKDQLTAFEKTGAVVFSIP